MKTGAKGIKILPQKSLLAFAPNITSETQTEEIRCILISTLKTALNSLIVWFWTVTEYHVFIKKNKNKTKTQKTKNHPKNFMPVTKWQHSLEISLLRTSCIFGPQDCNISSSCTRLAVSLILCGQVWHSVSKLSMKSIHSLIITKHISSETCSIYWIICSGKATSVEARFFFFFHIDSPDHYVPLGSFCILFPQLVCGSF